MKTNDAPHIALPVGWSGQFNICAHSYLTSLWRCLQGCQLVTTVVMISLIWTLFKWKASHHRRKTDLKQKINISQKVPTTGIQLCCLLHITKHSIRKQREKATVHSKTNLCLLKNLISWQPKNDFFLLYVCSSPIHCIFKPLEFFHLDYVKEILAMKSVVKIEKPTYNTRDVILFRCSDDVI